MLNIDSHHDFMDGALLEHPIIKGEYTFNAPPPSGLHPKGFFTKPGDASRYSYLLGSEYLYYL